MFHSMIGLMPSHLGTMFGWPVNSSSRSTSVDIHCCPLYVPLISSDHDLIAGQIAFAAWNDEHHGVSFEDIEYYSHHRIRHGRSEWVNCIQCLGWVVDNPADTLRNNDVVITSTRRHFWRNYFKMTSFWRYSDVIITSCVQWEWGV